MYVDQHMHQWTKECRAGHPMGWARMGTAEGLPRAVAGSAYQFADFNAFTGQNGFDLI